MDIIDIWRSKCGYHRYFAVEFDDGVIKNQNIVFVIYSAYVGCIKHRNSYVHHQENLMRIPKHSKDSFDHFCSIVK